jgi:hypothetical protein
MAEQSSNTSNQGGGQVTTGYTGTTDAGDGPSSPQQTLGELKQKVASAADSQKNRAAEGLGGIADVARQTGEELRAQNETLASWVNAASDQLRHMADRLRDRPAAELAEDLTQFARQRPALFLGGAFLLGLGLARLLKSSPQHAWQGGNGGRGRSAHGNGGHEPASYPETRPGAGEARSDGTWAPGSGAY